MQLLLFVFRIGSLLPHFLSGNLADQKTSKYALGSVASNTVKKTVNE